MLAGLLDLLRRSGLDRVTVVTKNGELPSYADPRRTNAISPRPAALLRALWRADSVILGGGTHFHDDYSGPRYRRHFLYLARIVAVFLLARALGRRTAFLGMGFGPFSRRRTRLLTRLGVWACHEVTVREGASGGELSRLGLARKVKVTFDLAACLPAVREHVGAPVSPGTALHLGISVTSSAASAGGDERAENIFWDQLSECLVLELERRPDLRLSVFVIRGGSREDDQVLSDRLVRRLSASGGNRVRLVPYHDDPNDMFRLIAESTAVVATRFHAALLAYTADRPILTIAYHRKLIDLADEIGLPQIARIDMVAAGYPNPRSTIEALLRNPSAFRPRLPVGEAITRATSNVLATNREGAHAGAVRHDG